MTRDTRSHDTGSSDTTDGLTLTRRAAMAMLGVGTLAGASGAAAAQQGGNGNGTDPTRKWNQHIDAQDHDLHNVRDFDTQTATLGNVATASRDADVLVWQDAEGTYHADGRTETVHSGENFTETVQAAIDSLTDGRTEKEKVVVACSGTMGPHEWDGDVLAIDVPSYTILDVRGTIYVEDENEALVRPLRAKDAEEIEIPRLSIVGNFRSAVWFKGIRNVRFGHIDIRTPEDSIIEATGGGVRIDNGYDIFDEPKRSTDIHVGSAYIENTVGHAFETYGVDRLQVGEVIANNPNYAGVLLNDTTDTTIGAVVGKDVDVGGGYATFRVANGTHDVTCGQVVANGGARGVFGVSACHDVTIGEVNIRNTDAHGMLIQDCQRFTVQGGVLKNCTGEAIRVDSRSSPKHPSAEAVSISNVRVVDTQDSKTQTYGINETGPGTSNNRFVNNDLRDAGTTANMSLFAPSTVVRDNVAAGVDHGTVKLTAGASPAARVEGVTDKGNVTLDLRAKARSAPGSAFAYDHHFEWTGSQWDLVVEWRVDPGEDVDLDYIVDRPQASIGVAGDDGSGGGGGDRSLEEGTYTVTSVFNPDDVVMSVDGDLTDGANVYMDTQGEANGQEWEVTEVSDGTYRLDVVGADDLVLEAADGGTDTGTNGELGTWEDADYQKWAAEPVGSEGFSLRPSHADLALDVWERDDTAGADLKHWNPTGDTNQTFTFD